MNDQQIILTMIECGGGFAKALGLAASRADADNLSKIKSTWPEMWAKYADMAAQKGGAE